MAVVLLRALPPHSIPAGTGVTKLNEALPRQHVVTYTYCSSLVAPLYFP